MVTTHASYRGHAHSSSLSQKITAASSLPHAIPSQINGWPVSPSWRPRRPTGSHVIQPRATATSWWGPRKSSVSDAKPLSLCSDGKPTPLQTASLYLFLFPPSPLLPASGGTERVRWEEAHHLLFFNFIYFCFFYRCFS